MIRMHIGHLALRATDPEASASFLTDILGLRRTVDTDDQILLSCNEKHHEIQLLAGPEAGVDHLGLELEDESDLEKIHDRLTGLGIPILSDRPLEPGLGQAIRFLGPLGLVFELYAGMEREPLSVEHYMPPLARRLGHVSFSAPDCSEMKTFLEDVLDFRLTDSLGGRVHWLRCDQEHHGIALVNHAAPTTTLHHYAFQLENWGAIQRYADGLAFQGRRVVWGPGRHGPGRNLFTYIPDPDNTIVEGYADLLEVWDEGSYEAMDWTYLGESALNLWGPMPPQEWREYGVPILTATPEDQAAARN
ncbi:MAG TPA: VOC family protein [Solirubrobacteraceae bacterium]|nr:VOC family protein [Solirubrobacteraceae bacterium]